MNITQHVTTSAISKRTAQVIAAHFRCLVFSFAFGSSFRLLQFPRPPPRQLHLSKAGNGGDDDDERGGGGDLYEEAVCVFLSCADVLKMPMFCG